MKEVKKEIEYESHDIKDKLVVIESADLTEGDMTDVSKSLKDAGARQVIFSYGGVEIKTLSDEDLSDIGLCWIAPQKKKGVKGKDEPHVN